MTWGLKNNNNNKLGVIFQLLLKGGKLRQSLCIKMHLQHTGPQNLRAPVLQKAPEGCGR